jgi:hypothetical protein
MKRFTGNLTYTFRWWRPGGQAIAVKHCDALKETAQSRIAEMIGKGYREGELNDFIRLDDADPPDGVEYRGWWQHKAETNK